MTFHISYDISKFRETLTLFEMLQKNRQISIVFFLNFVPSFLNIFPLIWVTNDFTFIQNI